MDEYDIAEAFRRIEEELMASIMRNMDRHRAEEMEKGFNWSMWQAEQLKSLEKYKQANRKKYGKEFRSINREIDVLIREYRAAGNMDQEVAILNAIKRGFRFRQNKTPSRTPLQGEFFKLNDRKLEALIKAITDDMERAETAILRMADDEYRKAIFNAQVYANTGAGTYERAVDMATKDMLSRGLTCVEYANGARHALSSYASMALRTAGKRAYLAGEGEMRQKWGIATVIVNKRGNPCPKCLPFCGKVLVDDVWSGGSRADGSYPLMSTAIAAGLYHPNCRDVHTTYFPGISTADDTWTEEELEQVEQAAKRESKQQYARRQQGKFGRLAKYSLDPDSRKRYGRKAVEWAAKSGKEDPVNPEYAVFSGKKRIAKDAETGIMISGARITDPFSREAEAFAEMYYEEIRSFSTDAKRIADNLGKSESDIKRIKAYLFEDASLFDPETGTYRRFDPDCAIAQSWQRLMIGKDIKPHDRTLIEHELFEMEIKKRTPGIEHRKAHELATEKYNYPKEVLEYYGGLEEHK